MGDKPIGHIFILSFFCLFAFFSLKLVETASKLCILKPGNFILAYRPTSWKSCLYILKLQLFAFN